MDEVDHDPALAKRFLSEQDRKVGFLLSEHEFSTKFDTVLWVPAGVTRAHALCTSLKDVEALWDRVLEKTFAHSS